MGKMSKKVIVIISLAVLIILCGVLFFIWRNNKDKKVPIQNNQLEKQISDIQQGENEEWKIYRNEEFGFEIKYPKKWTIDSIRSNKNKVVFNPDLNDMPGSIEAMNFKKNEENLTLEKIIEKEKESYKQVIKKEEFLTIDGVKAWKIDTTEVSISRIFFVHNNFQYEIESMGYLDNNDILNRFNFLGKEAL